MTNNDLKPCPFCGHEVKFFSNRREFECFYCGAVVKFNGYSNKSEIKLIDCYNERAIINIYVDRDFIVLP